MKAAEVEQRWSPFGTRISELRLPQRSVERTHDWKTCSRDLSLNRSLFPAQSIAEFGPDSGCLGDPYTDLEIQRRLA